MDLIDEVFTSITTAQLGLSIVITFSAGFVRGFVGFGAALILVMAFSVLFGPRVAIPVAGLAGIATTIQLLPDAIRNSDKSFVVPFGGASFFGAPVGTFVLISIDPTVMKIAISLFVLVMVFMIYRGWQFRDVFSRLNLISTGFVAGLIQGAAGVGGPPAVAIALSLPGTATC